MQTTHKFKILVMFFLGSCSYKHETYIKYWDGQKYENHMQTRVIHDTMIISKGVRTISDSISNRLIEYTKYKSKSYKEDVHTRIVSSKSITIKYDSLGRKISKYKSSRNKKTKKE